MTQRLIFTSTPPVPTTSRLLLLLFCAQKRKTTKPKPSSEQTDLQIGKEKKQLFGLHPDNLMPESAKVP
jgi:hypothetical protein